MREKKLFKVKTKGSLTIEAALVLPIFIYAIVAFVYFIQIIGIQESLQNAITETGFYTAKYAYVYDYILHYDKESTNELDQSEIEDGNKTTAAASDMEEVLGNKNSLDSNIHESLEGIVSHTIDSTFFKLKMQEYLNVDTINQSCLQNGYMGIHTYLSSYMVDNDIIDIIVIYNIRLPLLFLNLSDMQMVQRVQLRGWSGHKVALKGSDVDSSEDNENVVFITENGLVYHLTKACTHLSLSIKEAEFKQIMDLRNDSGGKYKKCLLCGGKELLVEEGIVFITNTGDRYHWDMGCSGLKRTIIVIPLSEIGERRLCKRCSEG